LVLSACGADDATLQEPEATTVPSDTLEAVEEPSSTDASEDDANPQTPGEPTEEANQVVEDDDTGFVLDLPPHAVEAATNDADAVDGIGAADDADAGLDEEQGEAETEPAPQPTTHPLEEIIIDDTPDDEQTEFVWDQAAALACAHTEFALDALIDEDDDALDETLTTAADYATQSENSGVSTFAVQLATTRDGATQDLVVDVLTACSDAGYAL